MLARPPLVSIIMPVYNNEAFVGAAIQSVLNQTLTSWEMIIVNDASTDRSSQIIHDVGDRDPRISIHHLAKNSGGPAVPRNHALGRATGRYITFLDADDLWPVQKLERHVAFMKEKNAAISNSSYRLINVDGSPSHRVYHPAAVTTQVDHMKRRNMGMPIMIDRQKTGDFRFNENAPVEDFDLFLRLLKTHDAYGCDEELYLYRRGPGHKSISSGEIRMLFNALRANAYMRHEVGVTRAAVAFAGYAAGVVRRKVSRLLP